MLILQKIKKFLTFKNFATYKKIKTLSLNCIKN